MSEVNKTEKKNQNNGSRLRFNASLLLTCEHVFFPVAVRVGRHPFRDLMVK